MCTCVRLCVRQRQKSVAPYKRLRAVRVVARQLERARRRTQRRTHPTRRRQAVRSAKRATAATTNCGARSVVNKVERTHAHCSPTLFASNGRRRGAVRSADERARTNFCCRTRHVRTCTKSGCHCRLMSAVESLVILFALVVRCACYRCLAPVSPLPLTRPNPHRQLQTTTTTTIVGSHRTLLRWPSLSLGLVATVCSSLRTS